MTLTEFLLARIAEQEARSEALLRSDALPHSLSVRRTLQVALAGCAADRRIVEKCGRIDPREDDHALADNVLCILASAYADHPDYDQEWRP